MVRFYALWMGTLLQFCHATIYTNDWAIRIRADLDTVNRIAEKYGFTNMGQVGVIRHTVGLQKRLHTGAVRAEKLQSSHCFQSCLIPQAM